MCEQCATCRLWDRESREGLKGSHRCNRYWLVVGAPYTMPTDSCNKYDAAYGKESTGV